MFTIHIDPGAVVVHQDSPALSTIANRLTVIETTLDQMRVKLDTLTPDTSQLEYLQNIIKASSDALHSVVARTPST